MISIADTGYVLSIAFDTEPLHKTCMQVHYQMREIYLPQSVLTESAYMLTREAGNKITAQFMKALPKSKYKVVPLESEDISRIANLLDQYADSRIDFVDASVVAVAERLRINTILTIDRRDFSMIRPSHADYFQLLPEKIS